MMTISPEAAQTFYHLALGASAVLTIVLTLWFTFFRKSKDRNE
jgi:hypothetical protein